MEIYPVLMFILSMFITLFVFVIGGFYLYMMINEMILTYFQRTVLFTVWGCLVLGLGKLTMGLL